MALEVEEGAVEIDEIGNVKAFELKGEDYDIESVFYPGGGDRKT
jgi:hypothetical protein